MYFFFKKLVEDVMNIIVKVIDKKIKVKWGYIIIKWKSCLEVSY